MREVITAILLLSCTQLAYAEQLLGFTTLKLNVDERERPISVSVWYPAADGTPTRVTGNAVFDGISAVQDASMENRKLPLVLVSHGGLRSADDSGAWLTSTLAQSGRIAVEINGLRPRSAKTAVNEVWLRPQDVSLVLDAIIDNDRFSPYVNREHISVVGFALGGTAAIALGGGQIDAPSFLRSCNEFDGNTPDCAWYKAHDVALDSVDQKKLTETWRDQRIDMAVAIDAEYIDSFSTDDSLIDVPTLLISLGEDKEFGGFSHSENVESLTLPNENAFDGFGVCTPSGPSILDKEGGNPAICGSSRDEKALSHTRISDAIVTFLGAR